MLEYIFNLGGKVSDSVGHIDRTQWLYILCGVVLLGLICLRGFGSRKAY